MDEVHLQQDGPWEGQEVADDVRQLTAQLEAAVDVSLMIGMMGPKVVVNLLVARMETAIDNLVALFEAAFDGPVAWKGVGPYELVA